MVPFEESPIEALYWHIDDSPNHYLNLQGRIIHYSDDQLFFICQILDQPAAQQMVEVFSLGEPYNTDLLESLHRQARAHLSANSQSGSPLIIQHTSSVLIGSQEHRLLLTLPQPKFCEPLNPAQVHEFYQKHAQKHDLFLLESIVFSTSSPSPTTSYSLNIFNQVAAERIPSQKATKLTEILASLTAGQPEASTDQLLPRLIDLLKGNEQLSEEIQFIRAYHPLITGELEFILTTYEAALLSINQEDQGNGTPLASEPKDQIISNQSPLQPPSPLQPTHGITSYLFSSISHVTSAVTSRLPGRSTKDPSELTAFRERMLACNSANDLLIRDLNPLLEDYKSLLYTLLKE